MAEMHLARGFVPRRSVSLLAVAATALLFAACNDGDTLRGGAAGAAGGTDAGANSGGAANAGASGASVAGSAGSVADDAGAGGALTSEAGAAGAGEAGAAGEPGQVPSCTAGGALFVVGNYADASGNRLLLRTAAKAATFALVPAGVATPAQPPQLYLVERVCAPGGALIAKDESSSYRVDFTQTGSRFSVCLSAPVATLAAALVLPPGDPSHAADTGCAGKPFTVYTAEAL